MVQIEVKYFLNKQGGDYFPSWFSEVLKEVQKQDGFIDLKYNDNGEKANPVACLKFESQATLDKWIENPVHDVLVDKIELYFVKSPEVELKVT